MTRVKPENRKRARAPKVRSGCLTCKIRRVKCDEVRPSCHRCTSTSRTCDGYDILRPVAPPHQAPRIDPPSEHTVLLLSPTIGHLKDRRASRSLQFFQEATVSQLNDLYQDNFWSQIVLQVAYTEPSIYHAILSLSTFHEGFLNSDATDFNACSGRRGLDHDFALSQYNVAIRKLLSPADVSSRTQLQVHLISCLLFIAIEALQGNIAASVQLFRHGRGILQELNRRFKTSYCASDDILSSLDALFLRLQVQICQLMGDVDPDLSLVCLHNASTVPHLDHDVSNPECGIPQWWSATASEEHSIPTVPSAFSSLDHARHTMELLARSYMAAELHQHGAWSVYAERLEEWSLAFTKLKHRMRDNIGPGQYRAIALLEVEKRYFRSSLNHWSGALGTDRSPRPHCDPMRWDTQTDLYADIIHYAHLAVTGRESREQVKASPVFTFDYGLIPAVFSVIARCRDPGIRRKAVALLRDAPRQEGVWKSSLVAQVASTLIALEEDGLGEVKAASDVPASARIDGVSVSMDPLEKRAIIHYTSSSRHHQKYLEW